jgi:hypothetical protein
MMYVSKYYLTKANEIDPNELKTLTSLSILIQEYRRTNRITKN